MKKEKDENMTREEKARLASGRKKKGGIGVIVCGVLIGCTLLLVGMFCGGMLLQKYERDKQEEQDAGKGTDPSEQTPVPAISDGIVYSQEELDARIAEAVQAADREEADRILGGIKEALSQGTTTVETIRPFYPDDLVVVSGGRFHFIPIDRSLKLNDYNVANLNKLDTGEFQYLTDGQVTSHKGIDVSTYQGNIDWNLVAQDGVEFAIIRVGIRGWGSEGTLKEDERFKANIEGAMAAGVKVGVYFFTQAITEAEVDEEVQFVLNSIAPYKIDCPVVLDVEKVSDSRARMNKLTPEERTALALRFCQAIENAGYQPMLYHNTEMSALMIDIAAFEKYDKWYASYSDKMFYPYAYKIWQYSDKGRVNGIATDVDMNICFEPVWEQ